MSKPRNLIFAAGIATIMLFILGNWATSAQATGAGIIDAAGKSLSPQSEKNSH